MWCLSDTPDGDMLLPSCTAACLPACLPTAAGDKLSPRTEPRCDRPVSHSPELGSAAAPRSAGVRPARRNFQKQQTSPTEPQPSDCFPPAEPHNRSHTDPAPLRSARRREAFLTLLSSRRREERGGEESLPGSSAPGNGTDNLPQSPAGSPSLTSFTQEIMCSEFE